MEDRAAAGNRREEAKLEQELFKRTHRSRHTV